MVRLAAFYCLCRETFESALVLRRHWKRTHGVDPQWAEVKWADVRSVILGVG